uniref:NADH dehydrogenase subunit 6 n=1 Tax=Bathyomphalus contortus TaxID=419017 RepID=A0A7D7A9R6_9GAST|nr:NADH dehydrogenase subunit 6 [Bathyomphalus contortus]
MLLLFPIYSSPVFYSVLLFFSSVYVVFFLSVYLSSWYSYMLFLVYVGGLLVLFMYLCLMSSNDILYKVFPNLFLMALMMIFINSISISDINPKFLGYSMFESSYYLNLSVIMFLVAMLLLSLFIIVRIVSLKKSLIV